MKCRSAVPAAAPAGPVCSAAGAASPPHAVSANTPASATVDNIFRVLIEGNLRHAVLDGHVGSGATVELRPVRPAEPLTAHHAWLWHPDSTERTTLPMNAFDLA